MCKSKKQIIIIPGIMGSKLKYKEALIWPIHIENLLTSLKHIDEFKDLNDGNMRATGMIEKYYGTLEKQIADIGYKYNTFYYDWRKDNFQHLKSLEDIIDQDAEEIIIIAHSMGGILAKLFINYNKEKNVIGNISKLITLGTPWNGAADSYLNLKNGYGYGHIRGLFKESIRCFSSIYQLLPNKAYVESEIENYDNGFLEKHCKGLNWQDTFNSVYLPMMRENNVNYYDVLIKFYEYITEDLPSNIEHHEIIGFSKPTVSKFTISGLKNIPRYNKGDGTVPLHSAMSSTKYKYFIEELHRKLPGNNVSLNIINNIIDDKKYQDIMENPDIYSYEEAEKKKLEFKVIKIACPVTVSLVDKDNNVIYGNIDEMKNIDLLELMFNQGEFVEHVDNDIYFILDNNLDSNKLYVEAYDEGAVSISIDEYKNGVAHEAAKFKAFNINNSISAEVTIDRKLEECKISVSGEHSKVIEPIIVSNKYLEEDLVLPSTSCKFNGQYIKHISNDQLLASGEVFLKILDIKQGTYDVIETAYILNESIPKVINAGEEVNLNFNKGKNILKVYSTDIFGNTETIKEFCLYYIVDRIPKLKIKATPSEYTLTVDFHEDKELDKLNLKSPKVEFKFNDKTGVIGNLVEYNKITREITIQVDDELGTIDSEKIIVDECLLELILQSNANIKDFDKFVSLLGIGEFSNYKFIKQGEKRTYKRLTQDRLIDADLLEVKSDNITICIDKEKQYLILFKSLAEYIELNEDLEYLFEFNVFDKKIKGQTLNINLSACLAIESESIQYDKICDIKLELNENIFKMAIDTKSLRKQLVIKGISNKKMEKIYIVIYSNDGNKILKIHELVIK